MHVILWWTPWCRYSWFKMTKNIQWGGRPILQREARRRRKRDLTLEQIIFEEINWLKKKISERSKIKKSKFNFLFLGKSNSISTSQDHIGTGFYPANLGRTGFYPAGRLPRQDRVLSRWPFISAGPGFIPLTAYFGRTRFYPADRLLRQDRVLSRWPLTSAGPGSIPLTAYLGRLGFNPTDQFIILGQVISTSL